MKYLSLITIILTAIIAKAQTPDACILSCATATCPSGLTDLDCFCVTGTAAIAACIEQNCTAADLTAAQALGASVCGALSNSTVPASSVTVHSTSTTISSLGETSTPVVTSNATGPTNPSSSTSNSISVTSSSQVTSTSNHGSALSAGAIGGIVGGILGTLLLVSVAATFYLLGRRSRTNVVMTENQPSREAAVEKSNEIVEPAGNVNDGAITDIDVGGRLRYPNDQADVGGRLRSSA